MLTKILIGLGLIVTPFFSVPGVDVRDVKLTCAGVVAVLLSLSGLKSGQIRPIRNKWFYLFLAYILCSHIIAPNPTLTMLGMNVGNFWVWQPMYYFLVFGLMLIVVASQQYTRKDIRIGLEIVTWCGFIMGCYVILQHFGIDQFFDNVGLDDLGKMAGSIGNPTHVSPFIAMIIPIAIYLRKYAFIAIMAISVALTQSQVAMGAMIVGLSVYWGMMHKHVFLIIGLAVAVALSLFSFLVRNDADLYNRTRQFIGDNQRFQTYEMVVKDVNAKPFKDSETRYPFTGWGTGNFKYTFHFAHIEDPTLQRFHQAHNDYLELLYNNGIIGLALFLSALFVFFRQKMRKFYHGKFKKRERALFSSFVVACVTAMGTFSWQIGTIVFYSVFILGLLNNQEVCDA